MTSMIALYRGQTVSTMKMVHVSVDDELVAHVAEHLILDLESMGSKEDAALGGLDRGKMEALKSILQEARLKPRIVE